MLSLALLAVFAQIDLGCTGDGSKNSGGAAPDAASAPLDSGSPDDAGNCDSVYYLPPIITVVSSDTGSLICDATFTVLDSPDAGYVPTGAAVCNAGVPVGGCPVDASCQYALMGLHPALGPYTIEVSAPGFDSAVVGDVSSGVAGCVPTMAATERTVTLSPLAGDAGGDGGERG